MKAEGSNNKRLTLLAPLIKVLNEKISPLLREIEKLQLLQITKISVPTPIIVFFGDHADGKFSLISSLCGIRLPVGEDGNTSKRPLILKITGKPNNTDAGTEFFIQNERGVTISAKEYSLCAALKADTDKPLNFLVKKVNHPDVTLIDLPGTRRVSKAFIEEFISPKDAVVVNVVPSEDCFAQELISSNDEIAKSLVVFTKVDKLIGSNAENLKLKLNLDNVGDRFMCVRNRLDGENIKTAIDKETKLFAENMVLSCIDKRNVGLKALANKVVKVYLSIISNTLRRIIQDIDDDISTCIQDVAKLEKPSVSRILKLTENNLRDSFLSREFVDIKEPATFASNHLYRILENFFNGLIKTAREHIANKDPEGKFLMYELTLLGSNTSLASFSKPLGSMYISILKQSYDLISKRITPFVNEVMDFVDGYVLTVLAAEADYYPEFHVLLSEASYKLTKKLREEFKSNMIQLFESEEDAQLTLNPDFDVTNQAKIQDDCNEVIQFVKDRKKSAVFAMKSYTIYELGSSTGVDTKLEHLWSYPEESLIEALNLRFGTNYYIYEMFKRFCEMVGIHLHHQIKKFVDETFCIEMTMELEDGLKTLKAEESLSLLEIRERNEKRKEWGNEIRAMIQKHVMEVCGAYR